MRQSPSPGPGPTRPVAPPAAQVAAAAAQRQLGPHLASRTPPHPVTAGVVNLSIAGGALVVLVVAGALSSATDSDGAGYSVLRFVALLSCFTFVSMLVRGIIAFTRTDESYHLFAGGFAHHRNREVRAVTWSEIAELRPAVGTRGKEAGQVTHYRLVPHQGATIWVPLVTAGGHDQFMDQLMAVLRSNDIPIR